MHFNHHHVLIMIVIIIIMIVRIIIIIILMIVATLCVYDLGLTDKYHCSSTKNVNFYYSVHLGVCHRALNNTTENDCKKKESHRKVGMARCMQSLL